MTMHQEPREHVFPEGHVKILVPRVPAERKYFLYYNPSQVSYSPPKGASGLLSQTDSFILTGERDKCPPVSLFWDICSVVGVERLWEELKRTISVHSLRKCCSWMDNRTSCQHHSRWSPPLPQPGFVSKFIPGYRMSLSPHLLVSPFLYSHVSDFLEWILDCREELYMQCRNSGVFFQLFTTQTLYVLNISLAKWKVAWPQLLFNYCVYFHFFIFHQSPFSALGFMPSLNITLAAIENCIYSLW